MGQLNLFDRVGRTIKRTVQMTKVPYPTEYPTFDVWVNGVFYGEMKKKPSGFHLTVQPVDGQDLSGVYKEADQMHRVLEGTINPA